VAEYAKADTTGYGQHVSQWDGNSTRGGTLGELGYRDLHSQAPVRAYRARKVLNYTLRIDPSIIAPRRTQAEMIANQGERHGGCSDTWGTFTAYKDGKRGKRVTTRVEGVIHGNTNASPFGQRQRKQIRTR
jgi:hypothetical protein